MTNQARRILKALAGELAEVGPLVREIAANYSPRAYLKGVVIEAIQDERLEANRRAVLHELAMAEHMARTTGMSYAEAARLLGLEDEGGR